MIIVHLFLIRRTVFPGVGLDMYVFAGASPGYVIEGYFDILGDGLKNLLVINRLKVCKRRGEKEGDCKKKNRNLQVLTG